MKIIIHQLLIFPSIFSRIYLIILWKLFGKILIWKSNYSNPSQTFCRYYIFSHSYKYFHYSADKIPHFQFINLTLLYASNNNTNNGNSRIFYSINSLCVFDSKSYSIIRKQFCQVVDNKCWCWVRRLLHHMCLLNKYKSINYNKIQDIYIIFIIYSLTPLEFSLYNVSFVSPKIPTYSLYSLPSSYIWKYEHWKLNSVIYLGYLHSIQFLSGLTMFWIKSLGSSVSHSSQLPNFILFFTRPIFILKSIFNGFWWHLV